MPEIYLECLVQVAPTSHCILPAHADMIWLDKVITAHDRDVLVAHVSYRSKIQTRENLRHVQAWCRLTVNPTGKKLVRKYGQLHV